MPRRMAHGDAKPVEVSGRWTRAGEGVGGGNSETRKAVSRGRGDDSETRKAGGMTAKL